MSYVLRDYQQKASDAAVSFFANKAKKNNTLPTGYGEEQLLSPLYWLLSKSIKNCLILHEIPFSFFKKCHNLN